MALSLSLVDLLEIERTSSGEGRVECDINRFTIGEVSLANAAAANNHSDTIHSQMGAFLTQSLRALTKMPIFLVVLYLLYIHV